MIFWFWQCKIADLVGNIPRIEFWIKEVCLKMAVFKISDIIYETCLLNRPQGMN